MVVVLHERTTTVQPARVVLGLVQTIVAITSVAGGAILVGTGAMGSVAVVLFSDRVPTHTVGMATLLWYGAALGILIGGCHLLALGLLVHDRDVALPVGVLAAAALLAWAVVAATTLGFSTGCTACIVVAIVEIALALYVMVTLPVGRTRRSS